MAEPKSFNSSGKGSFEVEDLSKRGLRSYLRGLVKDIDEYGEEHPGDFDATGPQFLTHLCSMYLGIRGLSEDFIGQAVNPYLRNVMGTDIATGGDLSSRIWLTFSMKPIYGMLSDLAPITYYKKRWYFVLYAMMGTFASFSLYFFSAETLGGDKALGAFSMFFSATLVCAATDTLTQGKYSEVAKAKGSSVVTFVYACKTVGSLIASLLAGFVNDAFGPRIVCLIVVFTFCQLIPIGFLNYVGDKRLDSSCKPDTRLLKENPKIFTLAAGIALVAIGVSLWDFILMPFERWYETRNNWEDPDGGDARFRYDFVLRRSLRVGFGVTGSISLLFFCFYALPFRIARINVYLWLCRFMTLNFGFAIQAWFTSSRFICPDAPNFPNTVYQSMGNVMAALATLFAVWLFETTVVHWYAPKAFWVTTAFTTVGALFDVMIFTRFNQTLLAWTGLGEVLLGPYGDPNGDRGQWWADPVRADDLMSYLFGTQALRSVVDTLDNLPATLLLSKLCPKGLEVTIFATLVAFFNLGSTMSGQMGAVVLQVVGFEIGSYPRDFINGTYENGTLWENNTGNGELCQLGESPWWSPIKMSGIVFTLVVGSIILPLCTIPLTWIFIPNIRLDEEFLDENEDGAREVGLADVGAGSQGEVLETGSQASSARFRTAPRTQSRLSQVSGGPQTEAHVRSTIGSTNVRASSKIGII